MLLTQLLTIARDLQWEGIDSSYFSALDQNWTFICMFIQVTVTF